MTATARIDIKTRETVAVERAVPAHMLFLMLEQCQRKGIVMRADVMHHLNVACAAPLQGFDTLSVARLARRIDDAARALLHDMSPDDPRDGLYCAAMFCLTLVDEKRLDDVKNQAVLTSLLLMDDLKDERRDVNGEEAIWRLDEARWRREARSLLGRANLLGLYLAPARQLAERYISN